jgi:hypothetical protein
LRRSSGYAVALKVSVIVREQIGNVDIMPKGLDRVPDAATLLQSIREKSEAELKRVSGGFDVKNLEQIVVSEFDQLEKSIATNTDVWKRDIPGKPILNRFAGRANIVVGRLKRNYVSIAQKRDPSPFAEIKRIFRGFASSQ